MRLHHIRSGYGVAGGCYSNPSRLYGLEPRRRGLRATEIRSRPYALPTNVTYQVLPNNPFEKPYFN